MSQIYMVPTWFSGWDIALELLFGLVALAVALYSFKIYRLSGQREARLLGTSFSFIAVSYFVWCLINAFLLHRLSDGISILELGEIGSWSIYSLYLHFILFTAGIVTLFYLTSRIKCGKLYTSVLVISLLGIFLAADKALMIYSLYSILLIFVVWYYFQEYRKNNNVKTLLLLGAFTLLLFGNLSLIYADVSYYNYVLGHLLEFFAFILILVSLVWIVNGKKKK